MPAPDPTASLGHSPDPQAQRRAQLFDAIRCTSENLKIRCGRKHFALRDDVTFTVATALQEVGT